MSELLKLAERCEAAAGPDRELDFAIAEASGFERDGSMFWRDGDCFVIERGYYDIEGSAPELPRFTASLDAAMTLVPEGFAFSVSSVEPDAAVMEFFDVDEHTSGFITRGYATAATPALALCAAALRALAAQEPSS